MVHIIAKCLYIYDYLLMIRIYKWNYKLTIVYKKKVSTCIYTSSSYWTIYLVIC